MPNDISSRPQTLTDLMIGLMQDQDDSGDLPDTQLYDAQALAETVAVSDALALTTHGASYKYDVGTDYDAMLALEPGLIHWWKCHEASGNLADSGSSAFPLLSRGANTYGQPGPFAGFGAETAVLLGSGFGGFSSAFGGSGTLVFPAPAFSLELWTFGGPSGFAANLLNIWTALGAAQNGLRLASSAGHPTYSVTLYDTVSASAYSTPVANGLAAPQWNYLVITFDGAKTICIWVNSVLQVTYVAPTTIVQGVVEGLFISPIGTPDIAELAIYDHVLVAATIAAHFGGGAPDSRYGLAVYA